MEGPGPVHLIGYIIRVSPGLVRADGVGAMAVVVFSAERPGAVGIDTVPKAVNVERMWHVVTVPDVNLQALARPGINDGPRNAMVISRLIDVGQDQLVSFGDQVTGIPILAVYYTTAVRERAWISASGMRPFSWPSFRIQSRPYWMGGATFSCGRAVL